MPKKEILIVGERLYTETWRGFLERDGFNCHEASTMMDAIDYLRAASEAGKTQLFVQENMPILFPDPNPRGFPKEFETIGQYDRGAALIQYARKQGLIYSDIPAYLAIDGVERDEKYGVSPEGITKVIHLYSQEPIIDQMKPAHHRPTTESEKTL